MNLNSQTGVPNEHYVSIQPRIKRTMMAVFLVFLSSIFYVVGNYMVKLTLVYLHGGLFTSQFVRHSTSAVFLYFLCRARGVVPFQLLSKTQLVLVVTRGLFGFVVSISSGVALSLIHVTDYAAIYKIFPAHVLLLSWIFFREAITWQRVSNQMSYIHALQIVYRICRSDLYPKAEFHIWSG